MTKVWVLEIGCRHEGGHTEGVFATEEAGIAGAIAYMQKEIARDVEIYTSGDSTEDGLVVNGYSYDDPLPGFHSWSEHYVWSYKDSDGVLRPSSGGFMYVKLIEHDLRN